ncbi:hypothetical protein T484DRAFT_1768685 [Baffinella frigidus]|nr:hypothetical protein T484DRAFT_1768685 [Cryptophyta sp. CCMP2293]
MREVFDTHLSRLREQLLSKGGSAHPLSAIDLQLRVANLEAALEVSERGVTRVSAETLRRKDTELAAAGDARRKAEGERDALQTLLSQASEGGPKAAQAHGRFEPFGRGVSEPARFSAPAAPLNRAGGASTVVGSPDSMGTIHGPGGSDGSSGAPTAVGSPDSMGTMHGPGGSDGSSDLAGEGARYGRRRSLEGKEGMARELGLEERLRHAQTESGQLRLRLAKLERIQAAAQGTALAQEASLEDAFSGLAKLERIQAAAQGTALAQEASLEDAAPPHPPSVRSIDASDEALEFTTSSLVAEAAAMRAHAKSTLVEYDAAVHTLERDLKSAKETVILYHDRIVALAGKDDTNGDGGANTPVSGERAAPFVRDP